MNRKEISALLSGGPDDTCCRGGYRGISGLNPGDVLNKISWLINCFCSYNNSSRDKVICGNTLRKDPQYDIITIFKS